MTKAQYVAKAREYNHALIAHVKAGRMWAADVAADVRDESIKLARQSKV